MLKNIAWYEQAVENVIALEAKRFKPNEGHSTETGRRYTCARCNEQLTSYDVISHDCTVNGE